MEETRANILLFVSFNTPQNFLVCESGSELCNNRIDQTSCFHLRRPNGCFCAAWSVYPPHKTRQNASAHSCRGSPARQPLKIQARSGNGPDDIIQGAQTDRVVCGQFPGVCSPLGRGPVYPRSRCCSSAVCDGSGSRSSPPNTPSMVSRAAQTQHTHIKTVDMILKVIQESVVIMHGNLMVAGRTVVPLLLQKFLHGSLRRRFWLSRSV